MGHTNNQMDRGGKPDQQGGKNGSTQKQKPQQARAKDDDRKSGQRPDRDSDRNAVNQRH